MGATASAVVRDQAGERVLHNLGRAIDLVELKMLRPVLMGNGTFLD